MFMQFQKFRRRRIYRYHSSRLFRNVDTPVAEQVDLAVDAPNGKLDGRIERNSKLERLVMCISHLEFSSES